MDITHYLFNTKKKQISEFAKTIKKENKNIVNNLYYLQENKIIGLTVENCQEFEIFI